MTIVKFFKYVLENAVFFADFNFKIDKEISFFKPYLKISKFLSFLIGTGFRSFRKPEQTAGVLESDFAIDFRRKKVWNLKPKLNYASCRPEEKFVFGYNFINKLFLLIYYTKLAQHDSNTPKFHFHSKF